MVEPPEFPDREDHPLSIPFILHGFSPQVLSCEEEPNWIHSAGCGGDDDGT